MAANEPLAARMRPRTLDDLVGQEHVLGKDKLLYRAIRADRLGSVILYGPPGTGKTSIANVIANETKGAFVQLNATTSGKKDMESAVKEARAQRDAGRKTVLFIDEIHRFNKGQQDYLLPFVESGLITLVGATTENPYFEVNGALISRSRVFELKPLSPDDVAAVMDRAMCTDDLLKDCVLDPDARAFLSEAACGDVRSALNALELAALTTDPDPRGKIGITLPVAEDCVQKRAIRYDKDGDQHYDCISAYIESIRGSDPHGALYYLARMLKAGEDIKYIARWLMIMACTDVGSADPMALPVASAAATACDWVGMPKAAYILAHATIYLSCSPKTPSVMQAMDDAMELVDRTGTLPVPPMFQDASYKSAAKLGRGTGFIRNYDYPNNYVTRQHLPDAVKDAVKDAWLYRPSRMGHEKEVAEFMNFLIQSEQERIRKGEEEP